VTGLPLPPVLGRLGLRLLWARRFGRFRAALARPRVAQARVLQRVLTAAARTEYGRHYAITGRESYQEFRERVPIVDYDELAPWIERQASRGGAVVTAEPPLVYEQTSGSSGRRKLIPYTSALLASFNACFVVWAYDLLARGPRFETGRLFFSASPAFRQERATPSGVPLGFDDDSEYLAPAIRRLLGPRFVAPQGLKAVTNPTAYRLALATSLVAEPRLEIISVWSPTYLLALLEFIAEHRATIGDALARGDLEAGGRRFTFTPAQEARLRLLRADPIPWAELWPALKLLSCWTDGSSGLFVEALRRRFPGVLLQGKGLLATEAPITIPLIDAPAPLPLVDEVLLELEDEAGRVLPLHEVNDGGVYGVIVTQRGGLLRYRMHDRVVVQGRVGHTPCLRFVGRDDQVSDLVGEKLNETFARDALRRVFGDAEAFSFLVPIVAHGQLPHYICITDHPAGACPTRATCLEAELGQAFHYRQARLLGQLAPVSVIARAATRDRFERHFLERGLVWGDIKYAALLVRPTPTEVAALRA